MTTESLPEHIQRPHLRPVQPLPVEKDGQKFVALRDPTMLQQRTMVLPLQALPVVQALLQGSRSLEELAEEFKQPVDQFGQLVQALDSLGLLWGPTFKQMEKDRLEELRTAGAFPPRASQTMGDDADLCRKAIEGYFDETEDPEIEEHVGAIVAPHLDYPRGWPNYAAAYYPWRNVDAPDRVVILGTNHFGLGQEGVVLSEIGFESPLGRCPADEAVIGRLHEKLGRPLVIDQLDHLPEHSIDLHVPWLQHLFGPVPVVAALIPSPLVETEGDDAERISLAAFVECLAGTLDDLGGRTFFVASSDLSHVGPQFGEPRPVDEQRRVDVERHDREMMGKFLDGDAEEFLGAFKWNRNPTRWCSIGNMAALLMLTKPESVELIDYRQAYDEKGMALVSSAAMAVVTAS